MVNSMIKFMMLPQCNACSYIMTRLKQFAGLIRRYNNLRHRFFGGSLSRCSLAVIVLTVSAGAAPTASHPVLKLCQSQAKPHACGSEVSIHRIAANGASPWKLVRAKADKDGEATVSIMKTADTLNSDPDFAGLMVRCGARGKIDVLIVLVRPLPPKSRPQVTIGAGSQSRTFEGAMTAAGAAVVLPDEAGSLAGGPWQRLPNLAISVGDGADAIKGSVGLDGLGAAYSNLVSGCSF